MIEPRFEWRCGADALGFRVAHLEAAVGGPHAARQRQHHRAPLIGGTVVPCRFTSVSMPPSGVFFTANASFAGFAAGARIGRFAWVRCRSSISRTRRAARRTLEYGRAFRVRTRQARLSSR